MNFSFMFDAINLGRSILYIMGSQIMISKPNISRFIIKVIGICGGGDLAVIQTAALYLLTRKNEKFF